MTDRRGLDIEPVVVGLTRPPMMFFIPFTSFGLIFLTVIIIFIIAKNLLAFLIAAPLYGIALVASNRDKRLLDIFLLRIRKCGAVPNRRFWGGNSYQA